MKIRYSKLAWLLRFRLFCLIGIAAVSACATLPDTVSCNTPKNKAVSLYTPLRRAGDVAYEPLPSDTVAVAQVYKLAPKKTHVYPCDNLTIRKEVFLQRSESTLFSLKETHEFYAPDGTLITHTTDDVTTQLPASGAYTALLSLPVPSSAPPGQYRIVSKLWLARKDAKRLLLLGKAEVTFDIIEANTHHFMNPRSAR